MGSLGWWLLGLLAIGGGVYVYSRSTGKNVPIKNACMADLPIENLTKTRAAIRDRNSSLLRSYAAQADAQGWTCAARQIRTEAINIDRASASGSKAVGIRTSRFSPGLFALAPTDQDAIDALPDDPPGEGLRSQVIAALSSTDESDSLAMRNVIFEIKNIDGTLTYLRVWELLRDKAVELNAARLAREAAAGGPPPADAGGGGGGAISGSASFEGSL